MKLLVYSPKDFEIPFLDVANKNKHLVTYIKDALDTDTAIKAIGFDAISIFSGDDGQIRGYGTDVHEKGRGTFFQDHSRDGIQDVQLKKLLSFPNVLLTPHQGFITKEALTNIAETTFYNLDR